MMPGAVLPTWSTYTWVGFQHSFLSLYSKQEKRAVLFHVILSQKIEGMPIGIDN